MTNAEALRALALEFQTNDTETYRRLRAEDVDNTKVRLLCLSADELDRMQASLTARDTDLMRRMEWYRSRWLSCLPMGPHHPDYKPDDPKPHTPVVTPASEEVMKRVADAVMAIADVINDYGDLYLNNPEEVGRAAIDAFMSPAEQAQRKLNAEAWERNRKFCEDMERYDSYKPLPDRLILP